MKIPTEPKSKKLFLLKNLVDGTELEQIIHCRWTFSSELIKKESSE